MIRAPRRSLSRTAGARREDLTDAERIKAGVVEMADDVWAWCEKTGRRGRTVTVKVKWADFQNTTRSRTLAQLVSTREQLHAASLALIETLLPASKGIRLVGVTLSGFPGVEAAVGEASRLLLEPDPA